MPGIDSKHWHWLDDLLLPLIAAGAYAAWTAPLFGVYLPAGSLFGFASCLALLLLGSAAGRWAGHSRRGVRIVVAGGLAAAALSLLLIVPTAREARRAWLAGDEVLPAVVAGVASAVLLWWRGLRMTRSDHHPETARTFGVGAIALAGLALVLYLHSGGGPMGVTQIVWVLLLIMLVLGGLSMAMLALLLPIDDQVLATGGELLVALAVVLLAPAVPDLPGPESLAGPVVLWVSLGLVMRSLLGLSWALDSQRGRGGARLHVDLNWVLVIGGAAAAVVLLGLALAQAFTPRVAAALLRGLQQVVMAAVLVVALIVSALMTLAYDLLTYFFPDLGTRQATPTPTPTPLPTPTPGEIAPLPLTARYGLGLLFTLLAAAVVAWLLYRTARRLHGWSGGDSSTGEEQIGLFSWPLLRRQFQELVRRLGRGRRSPFVNLGRGAGARRAVRLAYRGVLARALAAGAGRERGQTPAAYCAALLAHWPQERAALEALTAIYQQARYGILPPTAEQVRAAQAAAAQVEHALRQGKPDAAADT